MAHESCLNAICLCYIKSINFPRIVCKTYIVMQYNYHVRFWPTEKMIIVSEGWSSSIFKFPYCSPCLLLPPSVPSKKFIFNFE